MYCEVDGAFGMYREDKKCMWSFCHETWRVETTWEENFRIDLKETVCESVEWILFF